MTKKPIVVALAVVLLGAAIFAVEGVWYARRKQRYEDAIVAQHRRYMEVLGDLGEQFMHIDLEKCEANRGLLQRIDSAVEEMGKLAAAKTAAGKPLDEVEEAGAHVRAFNRVTELQFDFRDVGKKGTDRLMKLHDTCPEVTETIAKHLEAYVKAKPQF